MDCHTHLVSRHRADEFDQRLNGASYQDMSAVAARLYAEGKPAPLMRRPACRIAAARARAVADGVTTSRSNPAMDGSRQRNENAARRAQPRQAIGIGVRTTFLARMRCRRSSRDVRTNTSHISRSPLPEIARAESPMRSMHSARRSRSRRIKQPGFRTAHELGLPVKLHADQLSDLGGAALSAELAVSPPTIIETHQQ